jgi:hypothetical protein
VGIESEVTVARCGELGGGRACAGACDWRGRMEARRSGEASKLAATAVAVLGPRASISACASRGCVSASNLAAIDKGAAGPSFRRVNRVLGRCIPFSVDF